MWMCGVQYEAMKSVFGSQAHLLKIDQIQSDTQIWVTNSKCKRKDINEWNCFSCTHQ